MVTTRYDFLGRLHDELKPKIYLEIGVQFGYSLELIRPDGYGIGVDPNPIIQRAIPVPHEVHRMTSDEFFTTMTWTRPPVDFAFIDGMHHAEYALRDFMNVERLSHRDTVAVFDDVSPYNAAIASRIEPPGGDWTGDVWKIRRVFEAWRPDLTAVLVDTFPTGMLVVWGLDAASDTLRNRYEVIEAAFIAAGDDVPQHIINNRGVSPDTAIELLREARRK